jgi:8-oxo-dGTP pyrophosphatase MutT (NUDIX family)
MSPDDPNRFAWLAEGNATQARKRVATKALIADDPGRILLVNPVYKDYWDLPGGMAEANEPPTQALQREIREELGLSLGIGRLLVLDWVAPHGPWDDQLIFLFDGGTLTHEQETTLTITDEEISEYRFFPIADAIQHLRPDIAQQLTNAIRAQQTGHIHYAETPQPNHPDRRL